MVVPDKSAVAAEEVEMVNYNQDEKHEAEDDDFNVWDGNPFPPPFPAFPSTRPDNLLCDLLYLVRSLDVLLQRRTFTLV